MAMPMDQTTSFVTNKQATPPTKRNDSIDESVQQPEDHSGDDNGQNEDIGDGPIKQPDKTQKLSLIYCARTFSLECGFLDSWISFVALIFYILESSTTA